MDNPLTQPCIEPLEVCSLNNQCSVSKAQHHLHFLGSILPPSILSTFYRGTMKSTLSNRCLQLDVWFLRTAERIVCRHRCTSLLPPLLWTIAHMPSAGKVEVLDHLGHVQHTLQQLLPSGSHCCLLHTLVLIHIVLLSGKVGTKFSSGTNGDEMLRDASLIDCLSPAWNAPM